MSLEKRESWGHKPYRKDMDFSKCKQSELTDEYGTPQEIANAIYYYDKKIDEPDCFISNSISMLVIIQKGISDETAKTLGMTKPKDETGMRPIGTNLEIANLVHHYLDWLRATNKRTWDSRPLNPCRSMLDACLKGMTINSATPLHYDEGPERH